MDRSRKVTELEALNNDFANTEVVIVTLNKGMSVDQANTLRTKAREVGAKYKVTKNTLSKIALKGTQFESVSDLLAGPTALTTSNDGLSATKAIYDFAKTSGEKLVILGGYYGSQRLDAAGVEALAKLPTLNEIRGKLVGILYAPGAQLARLASAYATKDQTEAAAS